MGAVQLHFCGSIYCKVGLIWCDQGLFFINTFKPVLYCTVLGFFTCVQNYFWILIFFLYTVIEHSAGNRLPNLRMIFAKIFKLSKNIFCRCGFCGDLQCSDPMWVDQSARVSKRDPGARQINIPFTTQYTKSTLKKNLYDEFVFYSI